MGSARLAVHGFPIVVRDFVIVIIPLRMQLAASFLTFTSSPVWAMSKCSIPRIDLLMVSIHSWWYQSGVSSSTRGDHMLQFHSNPSAVSTT